MTDPSRDRDIEDLQRGGAANLAGTLARALKPVYLAVIANLYGGEIFGRFVFCYATVDLLVGISVFGTDHGLWNFVSRYREAGRPDLEAQALRTGFLWTGLVSALFSLGTLLMADPLARYGFNAPELAKPLRIIAATIPAFALARVLLAATRGLRLMRYHVFVLDFGEMALIFILAPTFYLWGLTQQGAFWALLVTAFVTLLTAFACFLRHFSLQSIWLNRTTQLFSREVLSYDLALGWALVAGLLARRIDILILAHFQAMSIVGAYTLASEFAGALGKIRSSFSPAVIPVLAAKVARPNNSLSEPSAFMALSVTVLSLPIMHVFVVAGPLLLALYQPEFVEAYLALLVMAGAHVLHGLMGPPGEALAVAGLPRYVAIFASVQVALIAFLGWFLVPKLGMLGAALASGLAVLLSRVPLLIVARNVLQYSSLSRPLVRLLVMTVATIGLGGLAAVLLRDRWPTLCYAVGFTALLAYIALGWGTITSALKFKRPG